MRSKNDYAWLKWAAVFLLPLPLAHAVSWCTIHKIVTLDGIGSFNSRLWDFYWSIGLIGVTYVFSWSWTTIYLLFKALPYSLLVLTARVLLFKEARSCFHRPNKLISIGKWFVIVCLPMPSTLCLYRVLFPLLLLTEDLPIVNKVLTYLLLDVGLPYAAMSLLLHVYLSRQEPLRRDSTCS